MRIFRAVKNFIKLVVAVCVALAVCVCVKSAHITPLSALTLQGEHAYYLDATSSQALVKTQLSVWDLCRVRGESVCFTLTEEAEPFARAIVERYRGEILFIEEACGTLSYYAYVPAWGQGITLYGKRINLHIAISDSLCKVGTPIIFGGF